MNALTLLEDPEIFLAIEDLGLAGRGLAESVWAGRHAAVHRGEGVEFHSHRSYQPGDDLRRINWALYARQRRLYTKQSHRETRRPVYILLDASASMSVAHGPWSKWRYATRAAAGMAHLARRQGDAPALGILSGQGVSSAMPPRCSADHVSGICAALALAEADSPGNPSAALQAARALFPQRGFVIFLGDFLDGEDAILQELSAFRTMGHDVFALQILDPVEIELPGAGDFEFTEPEAGRRLRVSAEELQAAYAARVEAWRELLRQQSANGAVRWQSTSTNGSLTGVLRDWLEH